jgi:hypothetical protein
MDSMHVQITNRDRPDAERIHFLVFTPSALVSSGIPLARPSAVHGVSPRARAGAGVTPPTTTTTARLHTPRFPPEVSLLASGIRSLRPRLALSSPSVVSCRSPTVTRADFHRDGSVT